MNRPCLNDVLLVANKSKSPFFVKYEFVEVKAPIGDGTYSLCMKCRLTRTGEEFAVKILKLDHDASQEIDALQKCQDHKNIVKMIEVLQDKQFKYIVFELLSGGELFSRIQKNGYLNEITAHIYFKQIVEAVQHMHSKGIIHKDLKPENILFVDDDLKAEELRIVDFGFAQKSSSDESPPCFTLDYAAPESLVRGETKPSRDFWALGVILYTMLIGNTPFKPLSSNNTTPQDERNFRMQITENIRNGLFNKENNRWSHISFEARDLIMKLIKVNESERISLEEVLHHPWMLNNYGVNKNSSLRRTDSEETLVEDEDEENDDAIVINDDEFRTENENRDETRSIDDSSSGIVMSDRNEGSSVSHEEIDPNGHIIFENNDEEMMIPMVEEQVEPENLSLKENNSKAEEKMLDEEQSVIVPPEEVPLEEISQKSPSKQRTPKKGRSRALKQKPSKQKQFEIAPLDLYTPTAIDTVPLNLVMKSEEEFLGFDRLIIEDDNNFPLFGFIKTEKPDDMSKILMLYKPLFEEKIEVSRKNKRVLTVVKAKRIRNKTIPKEIQSEIQLPRVIQVIKMIPTKSATLTNVQQIKKSRAAMRECTQKIMPPPPSSSGSSRPVRACRHGKQTQKAEEIQKVEAINTDATIEKNAEIKKIRAQKRPNNNTENEVPLKQTRKVVKQESPSMILLVQENEVVKKPRTRKKINEVVEHMPPPSSPSPPSSLPPTKPSQPRKRAQKRKIEPEPPKMTVAEKKPRKTPAVIKKEPVERPPNVRLTRKQYNMKVAASWASSIANAQPNVPMLEQLNLRPNPSIDTISHLHRPAQNLSPKFKERLDSLRKWYIDNKEKPSLIPTRFTKPEPVEKSTINFSSSPLRTQYR